MSFITLEFTENFFEARKRYPYLCRFENNWATDALCHQYFKNHRRQLLKRLTHAARSNENLDPSLEISLRYVATLAAT